MDARILEARPLVQTAAPLKRPSLDQQIALFRRWRGLFVAVVLGALGLSTIVIVLIPPRYSAVAEVMIDPRRDRVLDLTPVLPDLPADASAADTQVEILKSRGLAEKVAAELALERDPEFNPALRPSAWARWTAAARPARTTDGAEGVTDRLMAHLKVVRIGFTAIIAISVRSASPWTAARIANAYVDLYLRQQLDAKTLAARRASDWLSARLGGLRAQVETAEHEVERYKTAHGLMTLTEGQGATITEQEISALDAQMAVARSERAEAEARLSAATAQLASGGQGDDLGEVLNSPVVQDLRKQRDEAAKQIAALQSRYGPRHPELLKAERQRTEIDAQIQQEIARVISNLRVQAKVARSRSDATSSALAAAKTQLAQSNGASVELKELERNLESVRTLYQSFLDRFKQTSAQDGMAQSDARIVSAAKVPRRPDFPNRPLWLAAAFGGAITLGVLAVWLAEAWEDGLYAAEDLEDRLGLPCMAVSPRIVGGGDDASSPIDILIEQPGSPFAEAIRALKANVLMKRAVGPIRTLAVTSSLPGEGKTTTCIALGRMLARSGVSVVVVDGDLRRRAINGLLAAPYSVGLLEVLSGAAELEDALAPGGGGMMLLPLGDEASVDDEVLESAAMDRLLDTLRRRFRVVLIDTAPVLLVAETRSLASKMDAVLFLTRWRKTQAKAAAQALKALEDAGAYVMGAAMTLADPRLLDRKTYGFSVDDYPFYRRSSGGERQAAS